MAWTKAPDHKIVDGELVALTQSEQDAINAERERNDLVRQKTEGIQNEAVSRVGTLSTQHDSVEDLEDLLDRWPHIEPLVTSGSDLDKTRKAAEDMREGVDALDGLPLDELKAVDPPSNDPFSDTPANPSTWRV